MTKPSKKPDPLLDPVEEPAAPKKPEASKEPDHPKEPAATKKKEEPAATKRKLSPLAVRLIEKYGCHACRNQVIEDDFLTMNGRYWCKKKNESLQRGTKAVEDCPDWGFNGDKELLNAAMDPTPDLPFTEEPPAAPSKKGK
jgi:hypothetical protein